MCIRDRDIPYYFNTSSCIREWKSYFDKHEIIGKEILNHMKSLLTSSCKEKTKEKCVVLSKTTSWLFTPTEVREKWLTQTEVCLV